MNFRGLDAWNLPILHTKLSFAQSFSLRDDLRKLPTLTPLAFDAGIACSVGFSGFADDVRFKLHPEMWASPFLVVKTRKILLRTFSPRLRFG